MKIKTLSVYVVAHEDDWQLFMEPNIGLDLIRDGHRTVIIHLTAGDAGLSEDYWLAREKGAISSVQYRLAAVGLLREKQDVINIRGHRIHCWRADIGESTEVECYFFRLPDGNKGGIGFPKYGNQSLSKLQKGDIAVLKTVDDSAEYCGWKDLVSTLSALVSFRTFEIESVLIHHQESDPAYTPHDHDDHRTAGQAVEDGEIARKYCRWAYQGYNISTYPADLNNLELFWKIGMFASYDQTVYNLSGIHHSTVNESHLYADWCVRRSRYRSLSVD